MSPKVENKPKYTEEALQLAIGDVKSGDYNYDDAAERRGVPKTTIWNRMHGQEDRHAAHEHEQALSRAEEAEIVHWCHEMEWRYLPIQLVHLIGCAEMIWNHKNNTTDEHLGTHWYEGFMGRHPELTFTTNKRISERRVMAKNPAYIIEYYVLLSNILKKYNIPPSCIFNMDEKGFRIGEMGSEKVIIMRRNPDRKDGYAGGSKQSGDRQTVTSIDCICADGTVLPPMIIMKGKTVQKPWLENSPLPVGTRWAASPSGWTDNELGVNYIKAFDEWTAEKGSNGQWRCLILDGHGSHLTYEFLQYAHNARIIVVGLPSHTTDFLQPLDRVIFRVLQRFYGHAVDNRARNMLTVNKRNFAEVLHEAREKTYTRDRIVQAFEATGIVPLDPYRSSVMQEFRARIVDEHRGLKFPLDSVTSAHLNPRQLRQIILDDCQEVLEDADATTISLRGALAKAIAVAEGSEARALLAETEVQRLRNAARARSSLRARRGRVGRARVYTQDQIEQVREQAVSRGQRVTAKGRERGRARGRGRNLKTTSTEESQLTPLSSAEVSEEESGQD